MMLPDAIHHHPRSQRILRRGDPFRQPAAPPARAGMGLPAPWSLAVPYRAEEAWLHFRLLRHREEQRRRRIWLAQLGYIRSLEIDLDPIGRRTGNGLIARAIGSESIVAVPHTRGDWRRT